MARTSKTMLNKSGKSGHPCLVSDFTGNIFSFSPRSMMLVIGLSGGGVLNAVMSKSCNPINCSLPDPFVCGILQARIWRGLPCPSPGDLPDPEIEPTSPALQADSLQTELRVKSKVCHTWSLLC